MGAALWLPQCQSLERLTGLPITARHNGCNQLSRHGWQPSTVAICFALSVWLVRLHCLAWLALGLSVAIGRPHKAARRSRLQSDWSLVPAFHGAFWTAGKAGILDGWQGWHSGRLARLAFWTAGNRPNKAAQWPRLARPHNGHGWQGRYYASREAGRPCSAL
jgi:hypothetical protein